MKPKHPAEIGAALFRRVQQLADAANEGLAAGRLAGSHQTLTEAETMAIGRWLARFVDMPGYFDDCFEEAARFLNWAIHVRGIAIVGLTGKDALAFKIYLSTAKRGLSPERQRLAYQVAIGIGGALADNGYSPQGSLEKPTRAGTVRTRFGDRLPAEAHWKSVHRHVELLPRNTLREQQHFERLRWVLRLLHQTGLTATSAAEVRASDFVQRQGRWRLRVGAAGGAERELAVADQLLADFQRYRTFHGLPADGLALDAGPAIRTITGKWERFLTPTSIQLMVKGVFFDAAIAMEATDPVGASELRRAFLSWLHRDEPDHGRVGDPGTDRTR